MKYGLNRFGCGTGDYTPESPNTPTETVITASAIREVKKHYKDAVILKIHGGGYQRSGLPDIYIQIQGKPIWIEMKRPGADTTKLQKNMLTTLYAAGAYCGTAESADRVLDIIQQVLEV